MPKIRFIIQAPPSLGFGGGHVQALMYRKYIQKLGYDADFLDFSDPADDFDILHVFGMQSGNSLIADDAKKKGKRIVLSPIFYTESRILPYKLTNWVLRNKVLAFSQNRFFLMQRLIDISDAILPNSEAEFSQLKSIFDAPREKTQIMYNGVEPDLFSGVKDTAFSEKYAVPKGYILCVANINPRKNTLRLLQAFLRTSLNKKLVLVGNFSTDPDSEYSRAVKDLIRENKDRVLHVQGLRYGDELLLSAYLGAGVHILPSILETPGLASLEAGLGGAKLVVGECAPVREYFGSHALYCDPLSVEDISEKIMTAEGSPATPETRDFIRQKFSWDKIAEQLSKVYMPQ